MPESVTTAIQEGRVSLSTAATVQMFFQREKREQGKTYSVEQKQKLMTQVEGRSQRETEKLLAAISPQSVARDRERVVTPTQTEIRFVADDALMTKLQRVRELSSHRDPNPSYADLLLMMADLAIQVLEKKKGMVSIPPSNDVPISDARVDTRVAMSSRRVFTSAPERERSERPRQGICRKRYIPVAVKRAVWARDQGRCTFRDPVSGRACGSRRFLELDHIIAFANGGGADAANLRVRCRAHNQLWATHVFGREQMARYRRA